MQIKAEYAECVECGHCFNNGESIIEYDNNYFCNHECLYAWINDSVEEFYEIEIVEEYTNE